MFRLLFHVFSWCRFLTCIFWFRLDSLNFTNPRTVCIFSLSTIQYLNYNKNMALLSFCVVWYISAFITGSHKWSHTTGEWNLTKVITMLPHIYSKWKKIIWLTLQLQTNKITCMTFPHTVFSFCCILEWLCSQSQRNMSWNKGVMPIYYIKKFRKYRSRDICYLRISVCDTSMYLQCCSCSSLKSVQDRKPD